MSERDGAGGGGRVGPSLVFVAHIENDNDTTKASA
jgi:hypothetical protein